MHKRGFLGAYLSHIFTFTCQYDLQTKKRGLRNGHNQKGGGGVSRARPKRGVLGAGQVKQSGPLPPHIPVLDIYASPPPHTHIMLEVGLQKSMGHGIYSSYLWGKKIYFETRNDNR